MVFIMRFFLFYLVITLILSLIDFYFLWSWQKFVKQKKWSRLWYRVPWFIAGGMILLSIMTNLFRSMQPSPNAVVMVLLSVIGLWYTPKVAVVIVMGVKDLVYLVKRMISLLKRKLQNKNRIESKPDEAAVPGRRNFIQNVGWSMAGVPFLLYADGLFRTTGNFRVHYIDVPIANLGSAFNGFRIVQLSDIHAGSLQSSGLFTEACYIIKSLNPDLIAITGDTVNHHPAELDNIIGDLSRLEANYGVMACLGNHEHYNTAKQHEQIKDRIRSAGIDLLLNESRIISIGSEKLNIAGIDNTGSGQNYGDIDLALSGISGNAPVILLAHDPRNWDIDVRRKRSIDLMLSGHTHGGQLGFDLFGHEISPAQIAYKQWAGLYSDGDQHLYVSRGLGTTGPPVRVGIEPEITMITLRPAGNLA